MLTVVFSVPGLNYSQLHAAETSASYHLTFGFYNKTFVLRISQFVFLATIKRAGLQKFQMLGRHGE
jgi:hypothetical protein